MVVALDIDGIITRCPEFFALLAKELLRAGHAVVIITFREDRTSAAADLARWGVPYSELVTSTLDACLEHGVNEWKGVVCRREGVDVFFEDDPDVLAHIDDRTLCFMPAGAAAARGNPCPADVAGLRSSSTRSMPPHRSR